MLTTPEFLVWAVGLVFLVFFGEGLAHLVGTIAFTVVTFGQVKVQGPEHKDLTFPWHGFARDHRGQPVAEAQIAAMLGVLLLIVAALGFFYVRTRAH